jgi:hypothetical protein
MVVVLGFRVRRRYIVRLFGLTMIWAGLSMWAFIIAPIFV